MAKYTVRDGDHLKHSAPAKDAKPGDKHGPAQFFHGGDTVEFDDDAALAIHEGHPGVLIPQDAAGRKALGIPEPKAEKKAEK